MHTDENITITFKRDGRYDEAALEKLNWFLRDWRREQQTRIDPRLIDVVWERTRNGGGKGPIKVVCGYRSPATNAMLCWRSRGVFHFSQHMLGRAMDFFIPGVPLEASRNRIAAAARRRGLLSDLRLAFRPYGAGSVRKWPRMTREQLVRGFPDGRTVHIPTDGNPLPGYALALADIRKRGSEPSEKSSKRRAMPASRSPTPASLRTAAIRSPGCSVSGATTTRTTTPPRRRRRPRQRRRCRCARGRRPP